MRVLLVDDHPLFREGLRSVLRKQPDIDEVFEAESAQSAYEAADRYHPDMTVMDLALPGTDGVAATRELLRRDPGHKVLLLSLHMKEEHAARAMSAGALGYAFKNEPIPAVLEAIRAVSRGQTYLAPGIDPIRLKQLSEVEDPLKLLSNREREIFDLLVQGNANVDVAKELFISVKTVETHRAAINRKLQVHSGAELMRFAATRGLIPPSM